MKKIVLLRHGESTWNQENRFTGWTDVGLNEKGSLKPERQARCCATKATTSIWPSRRC